MRPQKIFYLLAIILTILAGLGSRAYAGPGAAFIRLYVGDVLYATLFYWCFRWLMPARPKHWAAVCALAFCWVIELGQLYQAPWIDGLRATLLGRLVLGAGFLWSDFPCYTLGAALGWLLDRLYHDRG